MVSNLTIIFIAISAIISIILPVVAAIYFYKKYKISFKNVAVGALIFFVFVIILEALMHRYILITNTTTSMFFSNPWLYAIYGAFAAGIFEETGRFVGYRFLLKGRTERKDALAYGIGHGGLEAILLGGITSIQNLVFAIMINNGTLAAKLPEVTAQQIHNSLISTSSYLFLLGGFERAFAFTIQILLSLVVLYGIKERKYIYLLYAILIHAAIDFPAALFQKGVITNMWILEGMYALVALICLILIIKSKKYYEKELV
jgi:uncharacterized membrane protein YhfC